MELEKQRKGNEKLGNNGEKFGNNEKQRNNGEKQRNNGEMQGNTEEDDMAELDKFVISAMLAGVPFLKAKIKTFAKKKESRLKEKVYELEAELALKNSRLKKLESKNGELKRKLSKFEEIKAKFEEIKADTKARKLNDEIQISSMSEKFKMENDSLKRKLESANVTIEKNLVKIARLEARNISFEKNKTGQLYWSPGMFLKEENSKLEQKEMLKNLIQDQNVKEEYQESAGNTRIKSEIFCSDKQIQAGSDIQMQSASYRQIQSKEEANTEQSSKQIEKVKEKRTCTFCNIEFVSKSGFKSHITEALRSSVHPLPLPLTSKDRLAHNAVKLYNCTL